MMLDATSYFKQQFWAGSSNGTAMEGQNYMNPTKAVDRQYAWIKSRPNTPPRLVPGSIRPTIPVLPGDPYANGLPAAVHDPKPIVSPAGFPDSPSTGPAVYYGTPNAPDILNKLFWDIKIIILKALSAIGLYKGMIPSNPYRISDAVAQNGTGQAVGLSGFVNQITAFLPSLPQKNIAPASQNFAASTTKTYSSPFDTHTVIFSKEVLP